MKRIIEIVIEKADDGTFSAYSQNLEGVYAMGDSVSEVKEDVLNAIETLKTFNKVPTILKQDYDLVFHFDTESLLQYYKGILSNPAFEKLTGINQKLMYQYSVGLKKPRAAQRKKIEEGLHRLGAELLKVEL